MRQALLLALFAARIAHAGPSTTFLWTEAVPLSGSDQGMQGNGAGTVTCVSFVPTLTITGTSLTFYVTTAGSAGTKCGLAIYSANGATLLASSGALNCDSIGVKQATGLSPFTLTAGVKYQKCGCVSGGVSSLSVRALYRDRLRNTLSVPLIFNAANSCPAVVFPASLGAFGAADSMETYLLIGTGTP